jgi:hypothetical protein
MVLKRTASSDRTTMIAALAKPSVVVVVGLLADRLRQAFTDERAGHAGQLAAEAAHERHAVSCVMRPMIDAGRSSSMNSSSRSVYCTSGPTNDVSGRAEDDRRLRVQFLGAAEEIAACRELTTRGVSL